MKPKHYPVNKSTDSTTAQLTQHTRDELLDLAKHYLKRCNAVKGEYNFKNRLHLRAHLALQELNGIKSHWADSDAYKSACTDDMTDINGSVDVDNMSEQQLAELVAKSND